jgi:hypothetical protein
MEKPLGLILSFSLLSAQCSSLAPSPFSSLLPHESTQHHHNGHGPAPGLARPRPLSLPLMLGSCPLAPPSTSEPAAVRDTAAVSTPTSATSMLADINGDTVIVRPHGAPPFSSFPLYSLTVNTSMASTMVATAPSHKSSCQGTLMCVWASNSHGDVT